MAAGDVCQIHSIHRTCMIVSTVHISEGMQFMLFHNECCNYYVIESAFTDSCYVNINGALKLFLVELQLDFPPSKTDFH